MRFTVFVDENSHYHDESERYKKGDYPTAEAAVAACRQIVDDYLSAAYMGGDASVGAVPELHIFWRGPVRSDGIGKDWLLVVGLREGTLFGDMRSIIAPAMCGTGVFPGPVVSPSVGIASAGVGWHLASV